MSTFGGSNIGRTLVGGAHRTAIGRERRDNAVSASPPVLQKAVVVDIIYDVSVVQGDYRDRLLQLVNNTELVDVMPVNSLVAQIVSDEGGLSASPFTILFPLFSSHIQLPIQVGEIVHVIYQDFVGRGNKVGYWLSRIHGNRAVEDANYTHLDRQYDALNNLQNWSTDNLSDIQTSPNPSFPNGAGTIDTYTIRPIDGQDDPYADYLERSLAAKLQTSEVVPRWNKRPQELVVQGANNALICLGEDRAGPVSGSAETESKGYSGTIDIVAGRGRHLPDNPKQEPALTAPRIIENSRGVFETDKAPWRNKASGGGRKRDNLNEGDPDYKNDAARLLVTMQSLVDNKFQITDLEFPESTLPVLQPTNEADSGTINRSYVVGKADHIRMVARKDKENKIEGTLLLVREGNAEDKDLGFLFINKYGMNLDAQKMFFGKAAHEDPAENDNINYNDDEGPYEPWILWSKYKDTVDSLQKQINDLQKEHKNAIQTLRDNLSTILTNVETAFSANTCVPYGQNPGITAAKLAIASGKNTLVAPVDEPLTKIGSDLSNEQTSNDNDNVSKKNHSQKVYGE